METHIYFQKRFPENLVYEIMSKNVVWAREAEDSMAYARCLLDKCGYTRASTRLCPGTHIYTQTHTQNW